MRFPTILFLAAAAALAACDIAPGATGFPQAVRLDGNTVTLDYPGGSCTAAAPAGIGLSEGFSIPLPQTCPGVVEIGVARLRDPDVHVVQIVPAHLGPLSARGQAAGIAQIEVIVMLRGGAIAGYVGTPAP